MAGLVMNGESTCTSIRIECERASGTCRTATRLPPRFWGAGVVAVSIPMITSDEMGKRHISAETIRGVRIGNRVFARHN